MFVTHTSGPHLTLPELEALPGRFSNLWSSPALRVIPVHTCHAGRMVAGWAGTRAFVQGCNARGAGEGSRWSLGHLGVLCGLFPGGRDSTKSSVVRHLPGCCVGLGGGAKTLATTAGFLGLAPRLRVSDVLTQDPGRQEGDHRSLGTETAGAGDVCLLEMLSAWTGL